MASYDNEDVNYGVIDTDIQADDSWAGVWAAMETTELVGETEYDSIYRQMTESKYGELDLKTVPTTPIMKTLVGCKAAFTTDIDIENVALTICPTDMIPVIESSYFTFMYLRHPYSTFRIMSGKYPIYNAIYNAVCRLLATEKSKLPSGELDKTRLYSSNFTYSSKKHASSRDGKIDVWIGEPYPYVKFTPHTNTRITNEMKSQIQYTVIVKAEELATILAGTKYEKPTYTDRAYFVKRFLNHSIQVPNCIDDENFVDLRFVLQRLVNYENQFYPAKSFVCKSCLDTKQPVATLAEVESDPTLLGDCTPSQVVRTGNDIMRELAQLSTTQLSAATNIASNCMCKRRIKTAIDHTVKFDIILQNYRFQLHNVWKIRLDDLFGLLFAKYLRDNSATMTPETAKQHIARVCAAQSLKKYFDQIDVADRDNPHESFVRINNIKHNIGETKMLIKFDVPHMTRKNKSIAVNVTSKSKFNIQGSAPDAYDDVMMIYNYIIHIFRSDKRWYFVEPPTDLEATLWMNKKEVPRVDAESENSDDEY